MQHDPWTIVADLVAWLDSHSQLSPEMERQMRLTKITEENGEVAQAVVGVLGQNPRKGVTHTWEDVQGEVCDVILTAMVALNSLTPDAEKVFAAHLERVAARSLASTASGQPG